MVLQPEVLVDQEWRSNKNCLKTFPRHLLVLRKRAVPHRCSCSLTRVWEFFQIHSIWRFHQFAELCLKESRASTNYCHGACDRNNVNLQPFARFPSLVHLTQIIFPIQHFLLLLEDREEQTSCVQQDLDWYLLFAELQGESSWPFFEFLHWEDPPWSAWMQAALDVIEAGSRRSLGLRPIANSIGVLPLEVTWVFLSVAALRINWAGVICARVVWSTILGSCVHECQETLFEQSYTHLSSIWPWTMRSCRKSLHILHPTECLHVRIEESHISTNRLRIHLECIHPFMKFWNYFWWKSTLTWICCQMTCSSIQYNQESKGFVFNLCWSMVKKDEVSKFFCTKSAREIFQVMALSNCKMDTSSPRVDGGQRLFQEYPNGWSSSWAARWTYCSVSGEGPSFYARQTTCW